MTGLVAWSRVAHLNPAQHHRSTCNPPSTSLPHRSAPACTATQDAFSRHPCAISSRRTLPIAAARGSPDEEDSATVSGADDDVPGFDSAFPFAKDEGSYMEYDADITDTREGPYEDLLDSSADFRLQQPRRGRRRGGAVGEDDGVDDEEEGEDEGEFEDASSSPVLGSQSGQGYNPRQVAQTVADTGEGEEDEYEDEDEGVDEGMDEGVDEGMDEGAEGALPLQDAATDDADPDLARDPSQATRPPPPETPLDYDELMQMLMAPKARAIQVEPVLEDTTVEDEKEAATTAAQVARREASSIVPEQQSFTEFQMEGVSLLVSEDGDGRLALADSYLYDQTADVYERPVTKGDIPKDYLRLQIVPWMERRSADTLRQKQATEKLRKVYFLKVLTERPYEIDMTTVYAFDDASRVMTQEAVHAARPLWTMREPTLRIRPNGITVEDAQLLPDARLISEGEVFEDDIEAMKPVALTPEQIFAAEEVDEEEREARMRELEEEEKMTLELDLDIPASDMM